MRFEGKTEIDWFSTSRPHRCSNLDVCDEFKLSKASAAFPVLSSAKMEQTKFFADGSMARALTIGLEEACQ